MPLKNLLKRPGTDPGYRKGGELRTPNQLHVVVSHPPNFRIFMTSSTVSLVQPDPYAGGEGLDLVTCYTPSCSSVLYRPAPIRLQHCSLLHSSCGCFR